ncbi:hypothetical protein AB0K60_09160 [Thermopolyspora sp. NPDC052614]|uniref:hypothetical protein n=1 Tax=Thermopolyspora sp. NPDC052614 TaxID=3155682 RepID=UPI003438BFF2
MLERLIGPDRTRREPAAVRELIRRTGGHPHIIQAVGTRIASRPGWGIAEAVGRLGPSGPDLPVPPECEAIVGPYESAVERLSLAEVEAFYFLSLLDEPDFSLATASAVLNLPHAAAAVLLESLVDVHLLESAGPDRYRYQEPLRNYARDHVGDRLAARRAAAARFRRLDDARTGRLYVGAG